MSKKRVLVFPCGSEIALEIYRSLKYSIHFELVGASSVSDHGKFVYDSYIGGLPFVSDAAFIPAIKRLVKEQGIDLIYPAMDSVITVLKKHEGELGCPVVSSPAETAEICLSKEKTYTALEGAVRIPAVYDADAVPAYPVFCKPRIGYGSRGTKKIVDEAMLRQHLREYPDTLILEYLAGEEYTVDCFTDNGGQLLFSGARVRSRISNGISVNTRPVEDQSEFTAIAQAVNRRLRLQGAWFVQLKRNAAGDLVLLEVACRLGGSSALYRARGVNFAQLSLFSALGLPVSILDNGYAVELDRALDNRYKLDISYNEVFVDYDDSLILEGKYYNPELLRFLYHCKNHAVRLTLLSAHRGDLGESVESFGLSALFDRTIHVAAGLTKADYIDNPNAIFIDDSFAERRRVRDRFAIPVFSVDMVEALL